MPSVVSLINILISPLTHVFLCPVSNNEKSKHEFQIGSNQRLTCTPRMWCLVALVLCEVSGQLAFYRMNEPCLKETESPQAPSVFIPYPSNMSHPTPLNYQLDQLLWWKPPTWYFLALAVWRWCHQCLISSATLPLRLGIGLVLGEVWATGFLKGLMS